MREKNTKVNSCSQSELSYIGSAACSLCGIVGLGCGEEQLAQAGAQAAARGARGESERPEDHRHATHNGVAGGCV